MSWWNKKDKKEAGSDGTLAWDTQAREQIGQAVAQAPVPALLKGKLRSELEAAAEAAARKAGHTSVTAEDVVAGMLDKIPPALRDRVAQAMQQGPEGLKNLEQELRNQK